MGLFSRVKDAQQQAKEAMHNTGGMGGMKGMLGGMSMGGQAEYAQRANKLGKSGVEAPGVVRAIRPTGKGSGGGGQWVDFDVTISPSGGQPYDATINQSMLPAQLEGLREGAAITVKYDPDDPAKALIYGW